MFEWIYTAFRAHEFNSVSWAVLKILVLWALVSWAEAEKSFRETRFVTLVKLYAPAGLFYIFWNTYWIFLITKFSTFWMFTYFVEYSILQKFRNLSCGKVFWNINIPNKRLNLLWKILISLQYSIFQIYQC